MVIILDDFFVDLDKYTVDHLRYILGKDDILNSDKIMLIKDTISQEDKVKLSLKRYSNILGGSIDSRLRYLQSKPIRKTREY